MANIGRLPMFIYVLHPADGFRNRVSLTPSLSGFWLQCLNQIFGCFILRQRKCGKAGGGALGPCGTCKRFGGSTALKVNSACFTWQRLDMRQHHKEVDICRFSTSKEEILMLPERITSSFNVMEGAILPFALNLAKTERYNFIVLRNQNVWNVEISHPNERCDPR